MAEKEKVIISVGVEGQKTVGELREELKMLQSQLNNTKKGTDEYRSTLKRLAEVRAEIKDLRDNIAALDPEKKAAAFGAVVNSITGGFQAASGAMALFGVESENVQKTMIKLQAAANLASGVQSVVELGKNFNILKTIIMSNPILMIGTVITAIGIALFELKDKIAIVGKTFEFLGNVFSKIVNLAKEFGEAVGIYDRKLAQLETSVKNLQEAEKDLTSEIDRQIKVLKAHGKETFDLEKNKLELIKNNALQQIKILEDIEKRNGKLNEEQKKRLNELRKKVADTNADIEVLTAAHNAEIERKNKEAHQKYIDNLKDKENQVIESYKRELYAINYRESEALKLAKISGDDEVQIKRQAIEAKIGVIQKEIEVLEQRKQKGILFNKEELSALYNQWQSYNNDLLVLEKEIENRKKAEQEKLAQERKASLQQQMNDEIAEIDKASEIKIKINELTGEQLINHEISVLAQKLELIRQYEQQGLDIKKQAADIEYQIKLKELERTKQIEKEKANARIAITSSTFAALQGLSNAFFAIQSNMAANDEVKQRQIAKKKFEVDKALNIVQATMNSYTAFTKALASYPPPFNTIVAGLTLAAGLAQVATIASQRFNEGAGTATTAITTPTSNFSTEQIITTTTQTAIPPQPLAPQGLQISQNNYGDVKEGMIVKAYIVDRDILTGVQKRNLIDTLAGF